MKTVLICPDRRPSVDFLARKAPLVLTPVLGPSLLDHILRDLAERGAREVTVLASDRPDQVRAAVGRGDRWGVRANVLAESSESTVGDVRRRFEAGGAGWLPDGRDVVVADRLPEAECGALFEGYRNFFDTFRAWAPKAHRHSIGVKEIAPGVWSGLRCRIDPDATLVGPCWVGEGVWVRGRATVGPYAYLEQGAFIDHDATVRDSWVGPATYVGALTELNRSLAWADGLLNWETGSFTEIVDAFLLSDLRGEPGFVRSSPWYGRAAAFLVGLLTSPVLVLGWLKHRSRRVPLWSPKRAVVPAASGDLSSLREMRYAELNGFRGRWRRWPQLWNIVRGDFTWVGNRPLTREQAAQLDSEFERLWLSAPVGLASLGDAYGDGDAFDDDARAHASFYAVRRDGKLNRAVLRWLLLGASPRA